MGRVGLQQNSEVILLIAILYKSWVSGLDNHFRPLSIISHGSCSTIEALGLEMALTNVPTFDENNSGSMLF